MSDCAKRFQELADAGLGAGIFSNSVRQGEPVSKLGEMRKSCHDCVYYEFCDSLGTPDPTGYSESGLQPNLAVRLHDPTLFMSSGIIPPFQNAFPTTL